MQDKNCALVNSASECYRHQKKPAFNSFCIFCDSVILTIQVRTCILQPISYWKIFQLWSDTALLNAIVHSCHNHTNLCKWQEKSLTKSPVLKYLSVFFKKIVRKTPNSIWCEQTVKGQRQQNNFNVLFK